MSPRTVQILRLVAAVLATAVAVGAAVGDVDWLATVAVVAATGLGLITRLEPILGHDLDGDGRVGPRAPRLP